MKITALCFLFLLTGLCHGQINLYDQQYTIFFESGADTLNETQTLLLQDFLKDLTNVKSAYKVNIKAYTDNKGSLGYNDSLSLQRALRTKELLGTEGFDTLKIIYSGRGIAPDYESHTRSRRADLTFSIGTPLPDHLGKHANTPISFTINNQKGGKFFYKTGTEIDFEPETFVDSAGMPVIGPIELNYVEYRNPVDFIFEDLPRSIPSLHEHFNSACTFALKTKDEAIILDKNIDLIIKPDTLIDHWRFYHFDGKKNEWTALTQPIKDTSKTSQDTIVHSTWCDGTRCEQLLYLLDQGRVYENSGLSPYEKLQTLYVVDSAYQHYYHYLDTLNYHQNQIEKFTNYYQLSDIGTHSSIKRKKGRFYLKIDGTNPHFDISYLFDSIYWEFKETDNLSYKNISEINWKEVHPMFNKKWMIQLNAGNQAKIRSTALTVVPRAYSEFYLDQFESLNAYINHQLKEFYRLEEKYKRVISTSSQKKEQIRVPMHKIKKNIEGAMISVGYFPDDHPSYRIDELKCFWELNKPYMNSKETALTFDQWLDFFFKHIRHYKPRYERIKSEHEEYESCFKNTKQIRLLNTKIRAPEKNSQKVTLEELGTYSFHHLTKIIDPFIIKPRFVDASGKPVIVTLAFLFNEDIKNAIRLDGLLNYSPYHFAFNPNSNNHLIALDSKGNSYLVRNNQFAQNYQNIKNDREFKAVFRLEKIKPEHNGSYLLK